MPPPTNAPKVNEVFSQASNPPNTKDDQYFYRSSFVAGRGGTGGNALYTKRIFFVLYG